MCVRGASASRCGTVGAAAVRYASARCSILGDWAEPMQWISARSIRRVLRATSPADSLAPGPKRCDKHVSVSRLDHCVQSFPSAPAALLKVPPPRWLSHSMARSAAAHHTAQEQERHTHHTHTHSKHTAARRRVSEGPGGMLWRALRLAISQRDLGGGRWPAAPGEPAAARWPHAEWRRHPGPAAGCRPSTDRH